MHLLDLEYLRELLQIMLLICKCQIFSFLHQNGIKQTTSALYHPASNGLAECAVKIFKNGMKKMTAGCLPQKLARF